MPKEMEIKKIQIEKQTMCNSHVDMFVCKQFA